MRYRYIHEVDFGGGHKVLSNIVWDGDWPMRKGEFPPEHPSNRFPQEFAALSARGYEVSFLAMDGDRCSLGLRRNQTKEQVLQDIAECLVGWERAVPKSGNS